MKGSFTVDVHVYKDNMIASLDFQEKCIVNGSVTLAVIRCKLIASSGYQRSV